MKIEIVVPNSVTRQAGKFACECQKKPIDMTEKEAKVFWKKKIDEAVENGDVLCELEIDKAIGEIQSPASGRIVETLIEEGALCPPGSILGFFETD